MQRASPAGRTGKQDGPSVGGSCGKSIHRGGGSVASKIWYLLRLLPPSRV